MHPEVLIGSNRGCPTFKEGDILDGNAILNLIKCVRWEEWSYGEKIDQHIADTTIHVTQEEKDRWDNNVSTQADWNEENPEAPAYILNKPDIYTKTLIDLMLATKADTSSLSTVATSGSYNDLTDTPTIPIVPTNVSAFNNDAGYLTEHLSLDNYYTKSQVDTLNSQQDTVIAEKAPQATTYTKTEVNALVSPKANLADLATVATSGSYNDLSNKPTIPTIPTNVSAFVNDAGYLTQHLSLDNYYNKTQVDTKLDGKQDVISNLATIESGAAKGATSLQPSDKAVANGLATLNENGIIPSSQLPSYVDDVLEYESSAEFPVTGESGKIYVDLFTNKTYRWGGSGYVEISESLALGETSSTAYAGDKGKATTDAFNAHAANTDIHVTAAKQAAWDAKSDFSGSYNDLTDKPTIPTVPTNVSAFTNDAGYLTQHLDISGKANIADLATVATSGSYTDLSNKPVIPDELADLQDDSTHRLVTDTEKSTWNAKSDFSGSYNDLTNKPTIPAAQVNSDWSANTGIAQILNKPTLSAVATSGSYNDLSNKPSIPSIWTGTQVEYDAIVVKDPDTIYIITSTS